MKVKRIVCTLLALLMLVPTLVMGVGASSPTPPANENGSGVIAPYWAEGEIHYKYINGKLYWRLWDSTIGKYVTDWAPCS